MISSVLSGCAGDAANPSEQTPDHEAAIGQEGENDAPKIWNSVSVLWINYTGADTPPPLVLWVEGAPGWDIIWCQPGEDSNTTCQYTSVSVSATWNASNPASERLTLSLLDGDEPLGQASGKSPLFFEVDPDRFLPERTYGVRVKPEYEVAVDLQVRVELRESHVLVPRV